MMMGVITGPTATLQLLQERALSVVWFMASLTRLPLPQWITLFIRANYWQPFIIVLVLIQTLLFITT
jgi:hypothetical protein